MEKRNYLIIGGSSGIGKQIVESLSNQGHSIFASYNQTLPEDNTIADFFHYDVLDEEATLENLPDEIHGVAYCPGSINLKPFHRFKESDFIDDYKLQVLGAVNTIQSILPQLKATKNASIVFFSTVAVQKGFNFHSLVSSSRVLLRLTRALAAELAPIIRVNAIAPSLTDTPLAKKLLSSDEKKAFHAKQNPLQKIGQPEDIADVAAFLLSDKSSWITGQVLHVDGGTSVI